MGKCVRSESKMSSAEPCPPCIGLSSLLGTAEAVRLRLSWQDALHGGARCQEAVTVLSVCKTSMQCYGLT